MYRALWDRRHSGATLIPWYIYIYIHIYIYMKMSLKQHGQIATNGFVFSLVRQMLINHYSFTHETHYWRRSVWKCKMAATSSAFHVWNYEWFISISLTSGSTKPFVQNGRIVLKIFSSIKNPASLRWRLSWENTDEICDMYTKYIYIWYWSYIYIYIYIPTEMQGILYHMTIHRYE